MDKVAKCSYKCIEAYAASKDTTCRNILIYGHCRYKDQGCAFNHDTNQNKGSPTQEQQQ